MKSATRNRLIYFGIIAIIILILGGIEYYLRTTITKGINEPYQISLYTHDGKPWSTPRNVAVPMFPGLFPSQFQNPKWDNPNTLKFAVAPYTIYKDAPNQRTPYFTTNSKGFRGLKEFSNFNKNQKRIIVVGGSAAFGHGLPHDDETFQVQMEKMNSKYEVINAGVGGYQSGQELTYVVTELVDYHPDIIVAFDGFNDLFWDWYADKYSDRLRKDSELGFCYSLFANLEGTLVDSYIKRISIVNSFTTFFNNVIGRSIVLSVIREKITKSFRQNSPAKLSVDQVVSDKNKDEYFEKLVNIYTSNLIKMDKFCHSYGIKFIVVFQPEMGQKSTLTDTERNHLKCWPRVWNANNYEKEFPQLYKRYITRSKNILTKKGIDFIDINDRTEYKNNPDTLFIDFVHLNKSGNQVVARIINEHIK